MSRRFGAGLRRKASASGAFVPLERKFADLVKRMMNDGGLDLHGPASVRHGSMDVAHLDLQREKRRSPRAVYTIGYHAALCPPSSRQSTGAEEWSGRARDDRDCAGHVGEVCAPSCSCPSVEARRALRPCACSSWPCQALASTSVKYSSPQRFWLRQSRHSQRQSWSWSAPQEDGHDIRGYRDLSRLSNFVVQNPAVTVQCSVPRYPRMSVGVIIPFKYHLNSFFLQVLRKNTQKCPEIPRNTHFLWAFWSKGMYTFVARPDYEARGRFKYSVICVAPRGI